MSLNTIQTTHLYPSLSWPVCSPGVSCLQCFPEHICSLHNACFSFSFSLSDVCFFLLSYTGASSSAHPLNMNGFQLFVGSLSLLTSHAFSEQSYLIDSSSMASITIRCWWFPSVSCWDRGASGGALYVQNARQSLRFAISSLHSGLSCACSLMNDENLFFPKRSDEAAWKLQYLLFARPA